MKETSFLFSLQGSLRVAAYDPDSQAICYTPYELVIREAVKQDLVEVSDSQEAARWRKDSDEFGKFEEQSDDEEDDDDDEEDAEQGDDNEGDVIPTGQQVKRKRCAKSSSRPRNSGLSLVVTADHDLYLQAGVTRNATGSTAAKWNRDTMSKVKASALLQGGDRDAFKFKCAAFAGAEATSSELPFVAALGLEGGTQVDAFLELYGEITRNFPRRGLIF